MNTEFNEEKEIELINSIIREAIVHGSDEGGAYEINEDGLRESVSEWLEYHDLSEIVKIVFDGKTEMFKYIDKENY